MLVRFITYKFILGSPNTPNNQKLFLDDFQSFAKSIFLLLHEFLEYEHKYELSKASSWGYQPSLRTMLELEYTNFQELFFLAQYFILQSAYFVIKMSIIYFFPNF